MKNKSLVMLLPLLILSSCKDKSGKPIQYIEIFDARGALTDKIIYLYDSKGNEMRREDYESVNYDLKITYRVEKIYDFNNNLIEEINYSASQETNNLLVNNKREYTYENNVLVSSKHYSFEKEYQLENVYTYSYYDNGLLKEYVSYKTPLHNEDSKIEYHKESHVYDDKDREINKKDYYFDELKGEWVLAYEDIYTYSDTQNIILTKMDDENFSKIVEELDSNGNIVKATDYIYDEGEEVLFIETTSTYDKKNNMTSSIDTYYADDIVNKYKTTYEYDSDNDVTKMSFYRDSKDEKGFVLDETYVYHY